MSAPAPAAIPSLTCPHCGRGVCETCTRVYKLTRQHLGDNGLCPYGHRSEVKEAAS